MTTTTMPNDQSCSTMAQVRQHTNARKAANAVQWAERCQQGASATAIAGEVRTVTAAGVVSV